MHLPFQTYLEALHRKLSALRGGAVASYIPELAKANPDAFGICVVTTDGYAYAVGDSEQRFTIQSISKPFVYGTALADRGREFVLGKVGVEPSGDAFNSISLNPKTGAPVNPMINAGAIATTSLVAGADATLQWQRIESALSAFAGRRLGVDHAVYASESATGFRNRAIAWMLRNFGINQDDPMPALENYFRQCALEVSCRDLAFMAATLANGGVHPLSGERAASAGEVEAMLSVMSTCGMYDYAGSWLYEVGMPAKSGVGGGIIAVLPGRFGIGVFSPPLDEIGNSARGIAVCRELSRDFGLHVFGPGNAPALALNRVYSAADAPSRRTRAPAEAAALEERADCIRYLELQGALALDGAEHVSRRIAGMSSTARHFILDLHRVTSMTPSAVGILQQCAGRMLELGGSLVASRLPSAMVLAGIPAFADNDHAVEWCENQVLASAPGIDAAAAAIAHPGEFALFTGVDESSLARLETLLVRGSLKSGDILMRAGTTDDDRLVLILSGEVSVLLPRADGGEQRLATLGSGGVVGEMVLLGQATRMATVRAEQAVDYLALSRADFERLAIDLPQLKIAVLDNLARELARKLGLANNLIGALAA